MKRLLKTIIIPGLLLIVSAVHGQNFNAGIFAGVTASQVDGDFYSGFNKLGMTAGAFVNREINYDIYWKLEIKWVMRGAYHAPTVNDPSLYTSSYHYIEFPLSVFYLWNDKVQAEGGFSPEVLIAARFWDEDGLIDPDQYPENRRVGLSVFGGVNYWFSRSAYVGLRYTYSAIPFRDPEEWNNAQYRGYFHNVIALTLGYKFHSR